MSEVRTGAVVSDIQVRSSGLVVQVGSPKSEVRVGTSGSMVPVVRIVPSMVYRTGP